MNIRSRFIVLLVIVVLAVVAVAAFLFSDQDTANAPANGDADLAEITLFLTFQPNVQFAPVYAALENGHFAAEGLSVTIEHGSEADGVDRIATNDLQFGIISGEQVILARQADKPLVYVMEWYNRFPVGVVVPADSDIEDAQDLSGKTVSVPFPEGATYMGLLALLGAVDLQESDITLEPIGFTAPAAMCERQIEAAVVYIANEPLQIEQNCFDVRVLEISDYVSIVSNGLVTNQTTINQNPELVQKVINALQKGIADTIADPEAAFALSLRYVPDLDEAQYPVQREVLARSVPLWEAETIGLTTAEQWAATQQALLDAGLLAEPLDDLEAAYTNTFVEAE